MPLLGSFVIEVVLKPSFNFRSNFWKILIFFFDYIQYLKLYSFVV